MATTAAAAAHRPLGLLAELTHRCPLGCPYCSNPLRLDRAQAELDTATWSRLWREAAALGILQVHLSGGEPAARRDSEFALDYVKRHALSAQAQCSVLGALEFKCDILWAMLDALYHAYVAPKHIPPGAFVPKDEDR